MSPLRSRPTALILAAAMLVVAACSDSTAPNDVLSADEANELARQMGIALADGLVGSATAAVPGGIGSAQVAAVPAPFNVSIDVNVPCPRGGKTRVTATVNGTIDEATESLTADVTGTQRPDNCGYDVYGKVIRVTGTLTTTAHAQIENGLPVGVQRATLNGEFSWAASDKRGGSCSVNYTAAADYTNNVATVNGSFCGSTITVTAPITN